MNGKVRCAYAIYFGYTCSDRLLVAQAQIESLGIISNDQKLRQYDVDVHW
jgi:PIN domain nuclease of toxin-antitoxin system